MVTFNAHPKNVETHFIHGAHCINENNRKINNQTSARKI